MFARGNLLFVAVFLGCTSTGRVGLWFLLIFVVLCPGTPDGSTDSGSGLKCLRRRGNGLKSHPTDWLQKRAKYIALWHSGFNVGPF